MQKSSRRRQGKDLKVMEEMNPDKGVEITEKL